MRIHGALHLRGTSMMEVLMAVFLVASAATVMTVSMPVANVARSRANYLNKATSIAEKELEAIRGSGYSNCTASQLAYFGLIDSSTPVTTNTYSFTSTDSTSLDNVSKVLPNGTGTILLEQADLDLRRITVTVSWTERGSTRTYKLATLVANL